MAVQRRCEAKDWWWELFNPFYPPYLVLERSAGNIQIPGPNQIHQQVFSDSSI